MDNGLATTYTLEFEVTDDDSYTSGTIKTCTSTFNVVITKKNDQCSFDSAFSAQTAAVDDSVSYTLPSFTDDDTADSHSSVATLVSGAALPTFITYTAATLDFSFDPDDNAQEGTYDIKVVLTDDDFHSSGGVESCED